MSDVRDLIVDLGGPSALANVLQVEPNAVRQWKSRNTIPPVYWPNVIELAERKKRPGVTFDWLRAAREKEARARARQRRVRAA